MELFQSPAQQASSAASAEQGISQQDIQQGENYVNQQEGQLRANIPSGAANPYLNAAASMKPSGYAVNPANTAPSGQPNAPTGGTVNGFTPPQGQPQMAGMPPSSGNPFIQQNPFAQGARRAPQPAARQ